MHHSKVLAVLNKSAVPHVTIDAMNSKVVPLRIRGGMPHPVPVHNGIPAATVGNAASPAGAQTSSELEQGVIGLPLLGQQLAAGAAERMARMQNVQLGQGGTFMKDEPPTQLSGQPLAPMHTQWVACQQMAGQQMAGQVPFPDVMMHGMQIGLGLMAPAQQMHHLLPPGPQTMSPPNQQPCGQQTFGQRPSQPQMTGWSMVSAEQQQQLLLLLLHHHHHHQQPHSIPPGQSSGQQPMPTSPFSPPSANFALFAL